MNGEGSREMNRAVNSIDELAECMGSIIEEGICIYVLERIENY